MNNKNNIDIYLLPSTVPCESWEKLTLNKHCVAELISIKFKHMRFSNS